MSRLPIDNIDEFNDDDGMYSVLSQSNPNIAYLVNFNDDYTCDCPSFPLIRYCKHLAAIHFHFYKVLDTQPSETLFAPSTHVHQSTGLLQPVFASNSVQETNKPETASLDTIATNLERLVARIRLLPHGHSPAGLQALNSMLDRALFETPRRQILPTPQRVAPNTGSEWKGPNGTWGRM